MLAPGPAKKVVIHLNEDTSANRDFLFKEILSFLLERGVAGASLLRPEIGFGTHHRLHTRGEDGPGSEHLPARIEFIETEQKLQALLPALFNLITDGLIEAQDTTILKVAVGNEPSGPNAG